MEAIKLEEISKRYGQTEAVKNVSMRVNRGQIYGFLGPNGAGKTTVMKMILNLTKPDCGAVEVLGETVGAKSCSYLADIGSIIETPIFYERLTAEKNLRLHCEYMGYYDEKRIGEVLDLVKLEGVGNKPVAEFSLGMKQRLAIARAIITNPKLLILDEPINGLDPIGIRQIRELLLKLKDAYGTTILISSHIISEIEQLADTIGVIDKGVFLREVPLEEVRRESLQYLEVSVDNVNKAVTVLDGRFPSLNYKVVSESSIRIYEDLEQAVVSRELVMGGVGILNMSYKNNTLEDYFMNTVLGGKKNV